MMTAPSTLEPDDSAVEVARVTGKYNVKAMIISSAATLLVAAIPVTLAWQSKDSGGTEALAVHLNPPAQGLVDYPDTLSGSLSGLRAGETVWAFTQTSGPSGDPTTFYPAPCTVDMASKTFSCPGVFVGAPVEGPDQTFRIWAGVVDSAQSVVLANKLRCDASANTSAANSCDPGVHDSVSLQPPHVGSALDSVSVHRK